VGATEEICPASLEVEQRAHLQDLALISFAALGLRDFARVDFKEDAQGKPCFLEANTLPGMTQTSLFPLAASAVGISREELVERMARLAARRKG
jgi:D-alanine-D-alanine ligase